MSLADLQPTIQKAIFRVSPKHSAAKAKLVETRGFLHPEVKGLYLHVIEPPFSQAAYNFCSVVHIDSGNAVAINLTFTQCYELMLLLKGFDWQRSSKDLKADLELEEQTRIIIKKFLDDIAVEEVYL